MHFKTKSNNKEDQRKKEEDKTMQKRQMEFISICQKYLKATQTFTSVLLPQNICSQAHKPLCWPHVLF